jgi:HEAT repeat protein
MSTEIAYRGNRTLQSDELADEIRTLFALARNEDFEDGFDSGLSRELTRFLLQHGDRAVELISDRVLAEGAAPYVSAAALRVLGEARQTATHEARRELLERSLRSPSHIVRDGAVLGLSDLHDPRSVPALEAAAAREDRPLLRANLMRLLERLRSVRT